MTICAMNRSSIRVGLFIAIILFAIGAGLCLVGLLTVHWMVAETGIATIKFGLFEVCSTRLSIEVCIQIADFGLFGDDHEINFIATRIIIIAGTGLAFFGAVAGLIFICMNKTGRLPNKGSFIATNICGISSVICIAGGVALFLLRIHSDLYDLEYSFILTCLAGPLVLIGCIIFPLMGNRYMASLQTTEQVNAGMVMSQFNPTQQSMQQGMPQQTYYVMGPPGYQHNNAQNPPPYHQAVNT